jgi:hypothetical protein
MRILVFVGLTTMGCASSTAQTPGSSSSSSSSARPSKDRCRVAHSGPGPERRLVVHAMVKLGPGVAACFNRYNQAGEADLVIDVAPGGAIEHIHVDGQLGGTQQGECLARAATVVVMPPTDAPYSICYPFILGPPMLTR